MTPYLGQPLPGPDPEEPRRAAAEWEQRWRHPEWVHPAELPPRYWETFDIRQGTLDMRGEVD